MSLASVINRSKHEHECESWRYTDVERILGLSPRRTPGSSGLRPQAKDSIDVQARIWIPGQARYDAADGTAQLIFLNGIYQPTQSKLGDLPAGIIKGDATDGYRLVLGEQTCLVTSPVELLFVTTPDAPPEVSTKLHIELGASCRLTLIERHIFMSVIPENLQGFSRANLSGIHGASIEVSSMDSGFAPEAHPGMTPVFLMNTTITLHNQSKLVHGKIVNGHNAHIALTNVDVAEGAYYDNFALISGGQLTRNEIDVSLNGKLSQAALNGAMLLRGRSHADTTTRIHHNAPHGTSRQVYKTVLGDQSRGVFQGKIIVAEGAQKTDGYQMSRALLLSDQAEMDAKPELEIYADDVKCSHGSTVGDLDAEAMFYLRSRGLSEVEARALLIRAFVDEILDNIHAPELMAFCQSEVEGWLK